MIVPNSSLIQSKRYPPQMSSRPLGDDDQENNAVLILHITKRQQWQEAILTGSYQSDTLNSVGFIHCSTPLQIIEVANAVFRNQSDLALLCIESEKVRAEIRYEGAEGGESYPHIYGPLNTDAVIKVLEFEPGENGEFELPEEINNVA